VQNNLTAPKLSLRHRLAVGIGVMLLPLVILGISVIMSFESEIAAFEQVENKRLEELFPMTDLVERMQRASVSVNAYVNHNNPAHRQRFEQLNREINRRFTAILASPSKLPEKQVLIRASQTAWQQVEVKSNSIFTNSQPKVEVEKERTEVNLYTQQAMENLANTYQILTHLQIADNLAQAQRVKRNIRVTFLSIFGLGLTAAGLAGFVLTRSILVPLRRLEEGVECLGEGDLAHRIYLNTSDELGQLATAFNGMAQNLEQTQAKLRELAIKDGLTGVYNRTEFNRRLAAELERSQRYHHSCALVMLDIDFFKKINDSHGHQAGDEALRIVAALLKREVRPTDQVARYGGEEFVIILPEASSEKAGLVAERLRQAIAAQTIPTPQGESLFLTASLGFAAFPVDAQSDDELIAAADQALYVAKGSGRNQVVSYNNRQLSQDRDPVMDS
jgi:two-component system, cell cycle response regulator